MNMMDLFGYAAMVLVLISMTMSNVRMLRIINSVACSWFAFYGFVISAYPIMVMNVLVIVINMYMLYKNKK